ncbi:hypothetical protein PVAP13_6NG319901 [Panicum virgatum]|uniref:Uncharacterized protein n=1 Tax=Panicum virgatum TaxID=38727 RepID=A0A8T0R4U5_PANVG|nr:hypothetical protein PVAP13_6NG319901 [Panicum virgatum]
MWRGGGAPRAPSRARAPSPALAHRSRARPRSSPADFFCLFISFTSPSFLLQPPIAPGAPRCRAERRKEVRPRGRLLLRRQGRCLVLRRRRRIRRWLVLRRCRRIRRWLVLRRRRIRLWLVLRRRRHRIRRWINTRRRPIQHQVLECHCSPHYIPATTVFCTGRKFPFCWTYSKLCTNIFITVTIGTKRTLISSRHW